MVELEELIKDGGHAGRLTRERPNVTNATTYLGIVTPDRLCFLREIVLPPCGRLFLYRITSAMDIFVVG